jgi:hypothetical protein
MPHESFSYFMPGLTIMSVQTPNVSLSDLLDNSSDVKEAITAIVAPLGISIEQFVQIDGHIQFGEIPVLKTETIDNRKLFIVPIPSTVDPFDLLTALLQSHHLIKSSTVLQMADIQIAVSPNWLLGSAPYVPSGEGGPATIPVEASDNEALFCRGNWQMAQALADLPQAKSRDVQVIILDTIPPEIRLTGDRLAVFEDKLDIYRFDDPRHQTRIELPPTFGPDVASIYRANVTQDLGNCRDLPTENPLVNEDYSDHGVFVADIVHQLSKDANLKLIQVLNDAAVGTMLGLLIGLLTAQDLINQAISEQTPTVVNLSLAFPAPAEALEGEDSQFLVLIERVIATGTFGIITPLQVLLNFLEMRDETLALASKFDTLTASDNVLFVAAAGNSSRVKSSNSGNAGKPVNADWKEAAYPSSADSVYTIGAVERPVDGNYPLRTGYSNRPDPGLGSMREQLWAFGGEFKVACDTQDPATTPADPHGGIIAMCTRSNTGFGWWAGTSFATGVASGALAMVLGRHATLSNTRDAMEFLQNECIVIPPQGPEPEAYPVLDLFQAQCANEV